MNKQIPKKNSNTSNQHAASQIPDLSYFGKILAKIKTGGKSNEPTSRMSQNLHGSTDKLKSGKMQTGSRTQAMPSPDNCAQRQDGASPTMDRQRESKYRIVDTSSNPAHQVHHHHGQEDLRTPGTKPSIVQINMTQGHNLNLSTLQPGHSASRLSRPSSLQRQKLAASHASSTKQKRIEQVAMNHQNMRKMLNDERQSTNAKNEGAKEGRARHDLSQYQVGSGLIPPQDSAQNPPGATNTVVPSTASLLLSDKSLNLYQQQVRSRVGHGKKGGAGGGKGGGSGSAGMEVAVDQAAENEMMAKTFEETVKSQLRFGNSGDRMQEVRMRGKKGSELGGVVAQQMAKTVKMPSTRIQSQFDSGKMNVVIDGRNNSNGKQHGGLSQTQCTPSGILKTSTSAANFNQSDRKGQKSNNLCRYDREETSNAGSGSGQLNKRRVIVSDKQSPISLVQQKHSGVSTLSLSVQGNNNVSTNNTNANRTCRKTLSKTMISTNAGVASLPEAQTIQVSSGSVVRGHRGPSDPNFHQQDMSTTDGKLHFQTIEIMEKTSSSPNKNLHASATLQNQRPPMSLQEKMERIKRESISYKKNDHRDYHQNTGNSRNQSQHGGGSSIDGNSRRNSNQRVPATQISLQKNLNISLQSMSKLSRMPSQHSQSRGDMGEISDATEPAMPEQQSISQHFLPSQGSTSPFVQAHPLAQHLPGHLSKEFQSQSHKQQYFHPKSFPKHQNQVNQQQLFGASKKSVGVVEHGEDQRRGERQVTHVHTQVLNTLSEEPSPSLQQHEFSSDAKESLSASQKTVLFHQGGRKNLVVNQSQSMFSKPVTKSKAKMAEYADAVAVDLKYDSNRKNTSTNGSGKKPRSSSKLLKPRGSASEALVTQRQGIAAAAGGMPSTQQEHDQKSLNRVISLNQINFANNKVTVRQKIQSGKANLKSTYQDSSDPQKSIKAIQAAFVTAIMNYSNSNLRHSTEQDLAELSNQLRQFLDLKREYSRINNDPDSYYNARITVNSVPLLHYLIQNSNNDEMYEKLLMPTLELGLNVNILDGQNENVLHVFFKKKRTESQCHCRLVKYLINYGVKVMQTSSQSGATPLHYLVSRKQPSNCDCIQTLMRAAAEQTNLDYLHLVNASGHSALHLAIIFNNPLFVKQLLDLGANPVQQNHQGLKPLHLACQQGSHELSGPKEILAQLIVGLLENSNNFQLNEKTINGGLDPLDLLLKEVSYPGGKTADSELMDCIKLLLEISFNIRRRHIQVLTQHIQSEPHQRNRAYLQNILDLMIKVREQQRQSQLNRRTSKLTDTDREVTASIVSSPSLVGKMEKQVVIPKMGAIQNSARGEEGVQRVPPLNLSSQLPGAYQDHTSEDPMSCDIRTFTNTSKQHAGFTSNVVRKQDSSGRPLQGPSLVKLPGNGGQAPPFPVLKHVQSGTQTPTSLREADEQKREGLRNEGDFMMAQEAAGRDSEFTTNQHIDQMRQEMMMSLDNQNMGEFSPRDSGGHPLAEPLYKQEMKYRQGGDGLFNQNDKHQGMQFEVIINRKREKILQIQGFREQDDLMLLQDGNDQQPEDEQDDKTLFVNLNRIFKDQMHRQSAGSGTIAQMGGNLQLQNEMSSPLRIDSVTNNLDYLTENPQTKELNRFPLKFNQNQAAMVQLQDGLGEGSHARVFKGDYLCTTVAIKVYDTNEKASLNAFIGELEAYYKHPVYQVQPHANQQVLVEPGSLLQHPNIVQVIGAYQKNNRSYLVTELSEEGNLLKLLLDSSNFPDPQKAFKIKVKACVQIAQALAYLHKHANVYHRDLKSENILVFHYDAQGGNIHVKLCDFGVSKRFQLETNAPPTVQKASSPPSAEVSQTPSAQERADRTQTLGTIPWMAPEFLEHRIFTEKSDIYSFGILMYEVFRQYPDGAGNTSAAFLTPYPDLQLVQISYQVVNEGLRPNLGVFDKEGGEQQLGAVIQLMKKCWSAKPEERPKSLELVNRLNDILKKC